MTHREALETAEGPDEPSTIQFVKDLSKRLTIRSSERAALSVVLERDGDGWLLHYGSLLIGPRRMSRLSWPDWVRHEGGIEVGLPPAGSPASFRLEVGSYLLGRASLTPKQAEDWLVGALNGATPSAGQIPAASARVGFPDAPALARSGNATPASGFVTEAERPVLGFLCPSEELPPTLPFMVELNGDTALTSHLIGVDVPTAQERVGEPARPGVFYGRLSRRAWMQRVRYSRDAELLDVWLRFEDADPYELEIDVRETVAGDLADFRRVRLADVPIPAKARRRLTVRLPTLGREIQRSLSLHGRGGELLDERIGFRFIEEVKISLAVNGAPSETIRVGDDRPPPAALERLEGLERVEEAYSWWFLEGARRRVIKGVDATGILRRRLRRAQRELLVIDSYFGNDPMDWDLLRNLKVPVRVLTGWKASAPQSALANVTARKWTESPIPFHDRFYLWDNAGINVGTSPNGLVGDRVFRIDELSAAELGVLRTAFEAWWADSRTVALF